MCYVNPDDLRLLIDVARAAVEYDPARLSTWDRLVEARAPFLPQEGELL